MTLSAQTSVGDLVAEDFRAAAVLERHGIDFCCGGKRTLQDACRERQIAPETVMQDLTASTASPATEQPRFNTWDLPTLIAYIIGNHHDYVRRAIPGLLAHTAKVAAVHGEHHPEMNTVADLFRAVADEMTFHMEKEEHILFPYISELAIAVREGRPAPFAPFGSVENPIHMMEAEHESAGSTVAAIRELTNGYQPPTGACTTYRVCLQELQAFERDLHQHVHLENNILFPKAASLDGRQ